MSDFRYSSMPNPREPYIPSLALRACVAGRRLHSLKLRIPHHTNGRIPTGASAWRAVSRSRVVGDGLPPLSRWQEVVVVRSA